jgi:hypothetical protein
MTEAAALLQPQLQALMRTLRKIEQRDQPRTQWDYAREVLRNAGVPLRARELADRMLDLGWQTKSVNPTAMLLVTLKYQLQRGRVIRPARGLWGLSEWQA